MYVCLFWSVVAVLIGEITSNDSGVRSKVASSHLVRAHRHNKDVRKRCATTQSGMDVHGDDDVHHHIGERPKLEGETENMGV